MVALMAMQKPEGIDFHIGNNTSTLEFRDCELRLCRAKLYSIESPGPPLDLEKLSTGSRYLVTRINSITLFVMICLENNDGLGTEQSP
jgi:hypothetical protein